MANEIKLRKNLSYLLKEQRWSLSLIARKAKMHKSTLHGYISGVTPRGLESLVLLAEALNVKPGDLIFGDLKTKSNLTLETLLASENPYEIVIRPLPPRKKEDGLR